MTLDHVLLVIGFGVSTGIYFLGWSFWFCAWTVREVSTEYTAPV